MAILQGAESQAVPKGHTLVDISRAKVFFMGLLGSML